MAALLLTPDRRLPSHERSRRTGAAAWEYDAIRDGLLSGHLSGQPMDPQDAYLLLRLLQQLRWIPDASRLAGAMPYMTNRLDMETLRAVMYNLGFASTVTLQVGRRIPAENFAGLVNDPAGMLWAVEAGKRGKRQMLRPQAEGIDGEERPLRRLRRYEVVHFTPRLDAGAEMRPSPRDSFSYDTLARFAPDLRLAGLLTLFSGCLAVAFSIIVIFMFDLVVTGQQPGVIGSVLLAAAGLFSLDLCFRMVKGRLLGRVSGRFEYLLGTALFGKLLRLPRRMIDQAPIGEQTARLRDLEGMKDVFAGPFAIVAMELPVTIVTLCAIAFFSPVLALVLFGVIAFFAVASLSLCPPLIRRASSLSTARSALTRLQMELVEKRTVICRNGMAWPWAERADRAIDAVATARFRLARTSSLLEAFSYLCMPVAATFVMFVGAGRVMQGALTGGELVAITMLTWRAIAPIQQGLLILPKAGDLVRLFQQIDTMMRFSQEECLTDIEKHERKAKSLSAANLFLRGAQAHVPALAGVSLEIPKGAMVALTGASGSGKSALLGILSGQLQPQGGNVRLDDVSLSELSSFSLGRQIVYVPQRPPLIYGSLAQNLRLVDPLVSDERIETVLTEVGLASLLARLPQGADTRIDPSLDSTLLAGGVRTAVAVAQAFLIAPSVLLLDEASENVDPGIEAAVFDALRRRRGDTTCLIATHRPSVIRDCDAVLQLEDGRASMKFLDQEFEKAQ